MPGENYISRDEHAEFAKRIDKENETQNMRIIALEKAVEGISQITVNVERLAISMENLTKEMEKQGKKLEEIENTPKDRYNTAVKAAINTIVGTVVGALIAALVMFLK